MRIGTPQLVGRRNLTQADYQAFLLDNLRKHKYRPRAPIHAMMVHPNNLFHTMADTDRTLLMKIMENVYTYGRANWTWTGSTSPDMQKAFDEASQSTVAGLPRGLMGRGLLDGVIDSAACGGFAAAFCALAVHIFNIALEIDVEDGRTAINGDFITLVNVRPIDSNWRGNVWMDFFDGNPQANKLSNRFLAAFAFNNHYFCNYKGEIYDVTCNRRFTNTASMIWARLTNDRTLRPNFPGANAVYRTTEVTRCAVPLPRYLVRINMEPSIQHGFSNWFLTNRDSIPPQEMQTMSTWSSR